MHLLILRFSSIGDVALTVPVLLKFKQHYPKIKLTMIAPNMYRSLFEPLGIGFIEADLKGKHQGMMGITRLYQKIIREVKPDKVIDLHSVLRTHMLQALFTVKNIPFFRIDKGRDEKARLTRKENKERKPLKHTTERYADVFQKAGFPVHFDISSPPLPQYRSEKASSLLTEIAEKNLVGIAPLAGYPGKTWPLTKVNDLINSLVKKKLGIVLFGGPADKPHLEKLKGNRDEIIMMAGKLDFAGEVVFMKSLKMMISMDSSNMHLATLAGIPVVSIWGATHPFAGFGPLGKNDHLQAAIPVEELGCRPCSVFGNRPCFRKDYACLNWLEVNSVLQQTEKIRAKS